MSNRRVAAEEVTEVSTVTDERTETETDEDREAIDAMNENGRSIEDRADAGEHEDENEDDGTMQLVLPGTGPKLSTQAGGKKPTESYFKMRGVSLAISGNTQVEKDTELWIAVPVAIDDVHLTNRRKDGAIASVKRTHIATPIGQPIIMEGPPPE